MLLVKKRSWDGMLAVVEIGLRGEVFSGTVVATTNME